MRLRHGAVNDRVPNAAAFPCRKAVKKAGTARPFRIVRLRRPQATFGPSTPRRIWSSSMRFEQGLEVALAESVVALALDVFEEDRADGGLAEALEQHLREAAFDDPFPID